MLPGWACDVLEYDVTAGWLYLGLESTVRYHARIRVMTDAGKP